MADKTKIQWTDASWNPISGCTKVSPGCKHCYAERLWKRLSAPNMPYHGREFTDVKCHPERLDQPLHWRKPRKVFVNSMSDLFHEDVSDDFILSVFAVMESAPQHIYQILTKRPDRMKRFMKLAGPFVRVRGIDMLGSRYKGILSWPPNNIWLGVSIEDQPTADERIPILMEVPAAIRFVSAEPLLGPIYLEPFNGINWVIVGSETGPRRRDTDLKDVRSIRDHCKTRGIPFFLKQLHINNKKVVLPKLDGVRHAAYPHESS